MMKTALVTALSILTFSSAGYAGDKLYDVKYDKSLSATKGKPVTVTFFVSVPDASRYHINMKYTPTSFKLADAPTVTVDKAVLTTPDSSKPEEQIKTAQVKVNLTLANPGKSSLSGTLKFAICTSEACEPQSAPILLDVDVK